MAASAVTGIRSSILYNLNLLKINIEHNAPNHFSIPSENFKAEDADIFLHSVVSVKFEGGRHQDRLMKVYGKSL